MPYPVMDMSWQIANITAVITTTLTGGITSPPAAALRAMASSEKPEHAQRNQPSSRQGG